MHILRRIIVENPCCQFPLVLLFWNTAPEVWAFVDRDDDDYDIDFYTADPVSPDPVEGQQAPSTREQLEVRTLFYLACSLIAAYLGGVF